MNEMTFFSLLWDSKNPFTVPGICTCIICSISCAKYRFSKRVVLVTLVTFNLFSLMANFQVYVGNTDTYN